MHQYIQLIFIIISVTLLRDCDAGCSTNDYITWEPVLNESAYVTDPASLDDLNGRPLGFQFATLEYIDNEDPMRPCVTIDGCLDRRVEVMVETYPVSMICVEDVSTDAAQRTTICQEKIYMCAQCPSNPVTYQFSCQGQSCDQTSVDFWFRFVISEDPSVKDPEIWCDERDTAQYPLSLVQPQVVVTQPPPTTKRNTGTSLSATAVIAVLSPLLMLLALH